MIDIDLSAYYVLKNELNGSSKALASTPRNDNIIVQPLDSSSNSQLWFFTETSVQSYYRLHTVGKGKFTALDVYNYIGRQKIDLHFYATQDLTGQYWRLNQQNDGSVKFSNNFTGPDMYLDVQDDTLEPTLAARDAQGQRWTLSILGFTPTPISTATIFSSTGPTTTSSTGSASTAASSSSCTSSCLGTSVPSGSKKISNAAVGGIVSAIGFVFLLVGAFILWRKKMAKVAQKPRKLVPNPILNA